MRSGLEEIPGLFSRKQGEAQAEKSALVVVEKTSSYRGCRNGHHSKGASRRYDGFRDNSKTVVRAGKLTEGWTDFALKDGILI